MQPLQTSSHTGEKLVHLPNELVDVLLPIALVTALDIVLEFALSPAASGIRELERPKEVRYLFEVRPNGGDLVNKIFNRDNVVFAQLLLNDGVRGEGEALVVNLAISAFVDKLTDRLQVRLAISDIRFHQSEHLFGCFCDLDENAIVDLQKS